MKVLVTIDASQPSKYVIDEAAVRPWPDGTVFSVLHVVDVQAFGKIAAFLEDSKQQAQKLVKAAAESLAKSGHSTESEVMLGFSKSTVSEYAKEWGADLVMAGSHGKGVVARFLLGSVAQATLRTALCSVEIVRPSAEGKPASSHRLKIVLATDGSEFSMAAVKSLVSRPWPSGSEVKIVGVVEIIVPEGQISGYPLSSMYPPSLLDDLMSNAKTRAQEAVENAQKILSASKLKISDSNATTVGDPRIVILDEAQQWGADMIVLGSHGRRGFNRLLLGSVSESVAAHAHCSVEVIRAPHTEHSAA